MTDTGTCSATALVVNKDINQLEFLSHLLRKTGIEPLAFTEAESAMKALNKESPPSIIVTDLYMPVIDGWKFCRMVRSPAFEPFKEIPVIVVSSVFSEKMAIDLMSDLQADAFLPYPPDENHFIEKVHALIAGEKSEKPSVIIVEHDKNLSSVIKNIFERHGYMVHTALTACEAAEVFKKTSCHIAVLNYNLPDRKGDTLLRDFCSRNPDCICLMMAGDITSELALKWMTDGADCIKKPFEPEQLMELCGRVRREKVFIEAQKRLEIETYEATERKQNKELLEKSEKRFRFMVEKLQTGAVYVEEDRVFLNRAAEIITGYKAEEIKTVEEWFTRLYKEKACAIKNLYEADRRDDFPSRTVEILTKMGEIKLIEFFSYAEQDRAIWLLNDITDRKKSEDLLRESEKELQWILKSMLNAFVIFESVFDDKGDFISYRFVYINDAYEKITGVKNHEVKGKTVHEVWPATEDEWVKRYGQVAVTGISQTFDMYHSPTGKLYHCNAYRPWDTQDRFCVIFEDITERKRTEEALKESERTFRSYIENAPDGIFLADEMGNYRLVNDAACRITGFTREELMQKNLTELTYPDDITVTMEHFRKVVTSGEASGEGRFVTKSGEVRHWIVKAVKLNEKNFLGFAADITDRRATEEALRESEARLKKVLEILPVGVWITDKHGRIIQNNPVAEQIWTGAKYVGQEELHEYKAWWYDTKELIKPEEWGISRAFRKGEISREELIEIECFNGTHKIILNWAMPLIGANHEIDGAVAVNQDITERKLIEEDLKSAYTKLEALWSVSSMADADIKTISDHILASITKMTGSDYGFYGFINEYESVMTIHSWSGDAMKDCSMVDKPCRFNIEEAGVWAEAIKQRKPFILNDYNVDHLAKKGLPEGHVDLTNLLVVPFFSQGRITSVAAVANRPLPYSQEDINQITSFLTGIQSIVEHKRTVEYIRLMADMLDEAPGSITVHDFNGKFLYANRKTFEVHGYNKDEFMSLNLHELDVPESETLIQERIELINRYGEASFEVYHVRKDKTTFPLNVFAKKVMWKDIPALLSIATDITERKMAEEEKERLQSQLLQAQKMESVGRLAGGVAHDFNNMLGIILGFTELALEQVEQKHNLYDHLKSIEKAATRSADLTRQLLAFARKQTIAPKVLDMNDTVSGMLRMIRRLIGEDIDLAWMPGVNLWPVMVDPAQTDQILANLCVNARDAIKGVGKVTIETENIIFDDNYRPSHRDFTPGEYVMLSVSDDGCGMDKHVTEHLFEPFFTTKEIGKGTGLGLATVYGIVRQNRGFINVYSEPGMGSTFKIYLPRFMGKDREACSRGTIEDIQKGSETVLLVEDEREMMGMIKIMLERLGYKVLTAINPLQAIKLAEDYSGEINLLITDVVMPEMNGRYLAEKLMSLYGNMKCLFMSGYTANVIAHHGVLEEGLMFIEKPFTRKDLAAKVRKALGP
jgi:PAS domain S-box-containing protein